MKHFTKSFFTENRKRFSRLQPKSVVLIAANSQMQYSSDEAYPFRQDSNFWYLTGINEADLVLVIDTDKDLAKILLPKSNTYQIEWEGETDKGTLEDCSGIADFGEVDELHAILADAKRRGLQICSLAPSPLMVEPYRFYSNPARRRLDEAIKSVELKPKDVRIDIARLRQIKQPEEITAIKQAVDFTAIAMAEVREKLENFKSEAEIEKVFLAKLYEAGSDGPAFPSIVANAGNAATIHYRKNDTNISNNSLLLLDVGAKSSVYCADISRTWAVGKPSNRQTDVYKAVLEVQQNSIARMKPGLFLKEEQERVNQDLARVYNKLKVPYRPLPTGVSHFLGIDVHDAGDYREELKPGSVITVEPGIYLPGEGIGVRIEDDILITEKGADNLSVNITTDL